MGRFANTKRALDRDDVRDCKRVTEITKEVCKRDVNIFVAGTGDSVMLQSCSADGTPVQVSPSI